jgi:hypothetical protein
MQCKATRGEPATAAAGRAEWDEAERGFKEALSLLDTIPYPYERARTLYERGLMEGKSGRSKSAVDSLKQAATIFGELGARPHEERARLALVGSKHS